MIKRFENKYIQSIRRGYLCHITPNKNVMDLNIIIIQMDVRFLMRNLEDVVTDIII